jgi:hypothetical protein
MAGDRAARKAQKKAAKAQKAAARKQFERNHAQLKRTRVFSATALAAQVKRARSASKAAAKSASK